MSGAAEAVGFIPYALVRRAGRDGMTVQTPGFVAMVFVRRQRRVSHNADAAVAPGGRRHALEFDGGRSAPEALEGARAGAA